MSVCLGPRLTLLFLFLLFSCIYSYLYHTIFDVLIYLFFSVWLIFFLFPPLPPSSLSLLTAVSPQLPPPPSSRDAEKHAGKAFNQLPDRQRLFFSPKMMTGRFGRRKGKAPSRDRGGDRNSVSPQTHVKVSRIGSCIVDILDPTI